MDRLACVDLPALPLQLLLRRHADWVEQPAAVVDRDHPQGKLLWVNEPARKLRVLPGQRYAAALSLTRDLRAGVVEDSEIRCGVAEVASLLRNFSPEVEPAEGEPGVFWIDASGLGHLFSSATRWSKAVHLALQESGYGSTVVVGFTRFGTYAAARFGSGPRAFRDPGHEQDAARNVPLERLDIDPRMRDTLARLGVHTVGQFLELPSTGIYERFGTEAQRLRRLAGGELAPPLNPQEVREPLVEHIELESPDGDLERLLFVIKRALDPLLARLADHHEALAGIIVHLALDRGPPRRESIRPAHPTLRPAQLLELIRLRFEGLPLRGLVEEITLEARGVEATAEQLRLFNDESRRDMRAAERALARVRAELGAASVVRARLREGHLPEAGFLWEPYETLVPPEAVERGERMLVRRLFSRAEPLPPRPNHLRDDGWLIRGREHGPVESFVGPYVVSGGWWVRPVHREYHFARTRRGDLLWVFYDKRRRRWYQQGRVE